MSLVEHAERELRLAGLFDSDSDYGGAVGTAALELVKVFAEQGHSGASAYIVLDVFSRLAQFRELTPITSSPDEWRSVDVSTLLPGAPPMWQSTRNPSVFSADGGKTWGVLA